jgi:hypothetical protein
MVVGHSVMAVLFGLVGAASGASLGNGLAATRDQETPHDI